MTYILVLIILGTGNAITPMPGTYPNKGSCYYAGTEAVGGLGSRSGEMKFTCVPTNEKAQ